MQLVTTIELVYHEGMVIVILFCTIVTVASPCFSSDLYYYLSNEFIKLISCLIETSIVDRFNFLFM